MKKSMNPTVNHEFSPTLCVNNENFQHFWKPNPINPEAQISEKEQSQENVQIPSKSQNKHEGALPQHIYTNQIWCANKILNLLAKKTVEDYDSDEQKFYLHILSRLHI